MSLYETFSGIRRIPDTDSVRSVQQNVRFKFTHRSFLYRSICRGSKGLIDRSKARGTPPVSVFLLG
jgi:hypothetical protein